MSNSPSRSPAGGGAFIALLIIVGTIAGGLMGQPSIGFLTGMGLGSMIALIMWLRSGDR